jgi:hypothetical protein
MTQMKDLGLKNHFFNEFYKEIQEIFLINIFFCELKTIKKFSVNYGNLS